MSDPARTVLTAGADAGLARLGRRIRWLVVFYALAVALGLVATTQLWPALLAHQPALAGLGIDTGALGPGGRIAALAALAVQSAPLFWIVGEALRLCRLMTIGRVFTVEVPLHLRRMGIALVAAAALQPAGGALLSAAISRFAGEEQHLAVAVSSDSIGVAVLGAVLIAIAAAAREAVRIADENSNFV